MFVDEMNKRQQVGLDFGFDKYGDIEYLVDGVEYDLVVVHVDKAIRLLCQLVALCDVAIPEVVTCQQPDRDMDDMDLAMISYWLNRV